MSGRTLWVAAGTDSFSVLTTCRFCEVVREATWAGLGAARWGKGTRPAWVPTPVGPLCTERTHAPLTPSCPTLAGASDWPQ